MNWPVKNLNELCDINIGRTPSRSNIEYWKNGEHAWLSISDMTRAVDIIDTKEKISSAAINECNCKIIPVNTVLLSFKLSIGKVGINKIPLYTNEAIAALPIKKKDLLHDRFLFHALKNTNFSEGVDRAAKGLTLNKEKLKEIKIPLPPFAEQQRIAELLDTADRILRLRESAIAKLDELAQSVFVEMFGDPITNSKKWKLDKLKNKATFENGDRSGNYPSGSDVIESGVLFLSTKNIVKNQLDLKHRQFISEEKFASLTRGKAKADDLIITLRGTLGSCCVFKNDRAFINAQMMIIRAGDEFVTEFLHSLLTNASMHRHLQEIGNGAAVQQLTAGQLGDMLIPIPPLSIQVQFKNQLNAIKSEIEKNQIALNTVLKLHSSLQYQSFAVN